MHRLGLLFLLAATFSSAQVDLGYRLHSGQVPRRYEKVCPATAAQSYPCVENLTIDGVRYDVVGYEPHHNAVKFLYTTDATFSTKSGLRVGDWVAVNEGDVVLFPGMHVYGPRTSDGWRVIFGDDPDTPTPIKFDDGTTVNLVRTADNPARSGKLRIIGFEKGGD